MKDIRNENDPRSVPVKQSVAEMRKSIIRSVSLLLSTATLTLSACADHPDRIAARYVSPVAYQAYNCDQLGEERHRLSGEVDRIAGLQRENANGDAVMLTVGLVVFWPALIGMAITKDRKEELGRLKGEYDAVDMQSRTKHCAYPIPGTAPPQPIFQPPVVADRPSGATATQETTQASTPIPVQRRSLGLEVLPIDEPLATSTSLAEAKGVYVLNVMPGGAAATAGLQPNDVILAFGPASVSSVGDVQRALSGVSPGSNVPVTLWRDQRRVQAQLRF